MSLMTLEAAVPLSSNEMATIDAERLTAVTRRHQIVADFLRERGFSALLLQMPENFAWFTAGGGIRRCHHCEGEPCLFLTPEARVLVCNNVDTALFFEHEVSGLGFQLKERPWTESRQVMLADLCRGRKVASDVEGPNWVGVGPELFSLRTPLDDYDSHSMRLGGRILAHALEATIRGLKPGRTETEIAGEIAHRLIKHGMHPMRIQVLADDRNQRFRHWSYGDQTVEHHGTLVALATQHGLHVGAARSFCFGPPDRAFLTSYERVALIMATAMFFSQPLWKVKDIWSRVKRIYEKTGAIDEWRQCEPAELVEYFCRTDMIPGQPDFSLTPGMAIFWHPSVVQTMMGDTILVTPHGTEWITPATDWPLVPVCVRGVPVEVPGILQLDY